MANLDTLKTAIQNTIKENGAGEITGAVLQARLLEIVEAIANGQTDIVLQYGPSLSEYYEISHGGQHMIKPHEFVIIDGPVGYYTTWSSANINNRLNACAKLDSSPTFTGEVFAPSFQESSDETLKDFGEDIKVDFEKLKALPKKYFTWKSGGEKQIGTSAQEVQKLFPEIVGKREDGTLTVDYGKLSMVALKAVDELYEKNKALEEKILKIEALILK